MTDRRWLSGVICAIGWLVPQSSAAQSPETIAVWNGYVAAREQAIEQSRTTGRRRLPAMAPIAAAGESVHVTAGTISDWRGSVFIRGLTLDRVLDRLRHPGTPPPQEDVVSARVLASTGEGLRLSIRLVRRAIVTVTYDTEHEMQFHRWSPRLATARSVATRIEEVGGSDHGFLWRLNSYWRYEELEGGVQIDLESLTLSRDMPSIIRPIAAPLVARIARESVSRTLEALQRFLLSRELLPQPPVEHADRLIVDGMPDVELVVLEIDRQRPQRLADLAG